MRKAKLHKNQTNAANRTAVALYSLQQQTQTAITASLYNGNSHVLPYVITDSYGNVTYAPMSNTVPGMTYEASKFSPP